MARITEGIGRNGRKVVESVKAEKREEKWEREERHLTVSRNDQQQGKAARITGCEKMSRLSPL